MKTQALVFPEVDKFQIQPLELEAPGPQDIVVRTLVSAISPGTERWILRGKHFGTQFPCVPGYQRIGIVEACGPAVSNFKTGDVVYGCGNRWKDKVVSMWGAHVGLSVGHWSGYNFLASSLPNRLELETMAFTIVAAVANRGIRFCQVHSGQKVLIIGAGFIGICAAQLAARRGATAVLLEKDAERVAFARTIVPHTFSVDDPGLPDAFKPIAPAGFDTLYDSVGHAATTDRMVQSVRPQGTLLLQAQYFNPQAAALNLDAIKIRELTVKTTCGIDDQDFIDTLTSIRHRMLQIAPMITHRLEAADITKGYDLLHAGKPFNMGIVFRWDDRVRN